MRYLSCMRMGRQTDRSHYSDAKNDSRDIHVLAKTERETVRNANLDGMSNLYEGA